MSLILWYKLDDVTSSLGVDSSGFSLDMSNVGVVSSSDTTYGNVAYFDGNSYLDLASASVPSAVLGGESRTYSYWAKPDNDGIMHGNGTDSAHLRYRANLNASGFFKHDFNTSTSLGTIATTFGEWTHYVSTYEASTSLHEAYVNGVQCVSTTNANINTGSNSLSLGRDPSKLTITKYIGSMVDFRVYDNALDATTISGLVAAAPLDVNVETLDATMYTHLADISWPSVSGATTYTVTSSISGGSETTIVSETAELLCTSSNLTPASSYTFNLYTDLDTVTPTESITLSTPVVDSSTTSELAIRLSNDFSSLQEGALAELGIYFDDALVTGDVVTISTGEGLLETSFIRLGEALSIKDVDNIFLPFNELSGSGQSSDVLLSDDSTTLSIVYDETVNSITVDGVTYFMGESFVLDGKKVTIFDV